MGGSVSQVFRSGSALLLSNHNGKVSETSIDKIQTIFEILRANPKISMQTLEGLLSQIAKVSKLCMNILTTRKLMSHDGTVVRTLQITSLTSISMNL